MNNLMQELDVVIKKYIDDRVQVDVNYRESFIRKLSEKADALKERAQGNETVAVRDANRIAALEWKLNDALESIDTLNARVSELQDDSGAELFVPATEKTLMALADRIDEVESTANDAEETANSAQYGADSLEERVDSLADSNIDESQIEDMVGRLVDEAVSNLTFTTTAGY
jgi:chromosome segregation ATPase